VSKVFKWDEVNGLGSEQDRVEAFLTDITDTYAILQLRHEPETDEERFMSYSALHKKQIEPDVDHYEMVYAAPLIPYADQDTMLEDLYRRFNVSRPEDFHGHSLSVSDVIAIRQNGVLSAHYVDTIGFQELPGFFSGRNYIRTLEDMLEQNDNQLDGIINNLPEEPQPCKCEIKKESVLDQLKDLKESAPEPPKDLAEKLLEKIRE
jgi:hypothetical protein